MIGKLRLKFVCVNMAIVTAMLVVIFGMVIRFTAESLDQQSLDMLQRLCDNRRPVAAWTFPGEGASLPYFSVSVNLWGDVTATTGGYYDRTDLETVETVLQLAMDSRESSGYLKDYHLRFQRQSRPFGHMVVFVDVSSQLDTLESLAKTCAFLAVLSLSAFLGLSILLARWAIRPVEQAWNQQRQFVADASHELKTPLSVILANAELLHNGDAAAGERERFSGNILEMSYRMRTLVEELLELARVDSGRLDKGFGALDFSELVQDAALSVQLLYEEKGLSLTCRVEEDIWLRGSRQHLYQLLDVLLDNARKYAEDGGTVRVELVKNGHSCLLTVANPGAPMDRAELQAIFKRFYRGDKARTMNGGYGLGLSIAQSVVQAHRGRIWAESAGGENLFRVQLAVMPGKRLPETEAPEV